MTDKYEHQRPLCEAISPAVAQLQWQHSVLLEPDYLSTWQAIEKATELANEVGTPCTLCVDSFSLPPRFYKRKKTVRFQLADEPVSRGEDTLEKFLPPFHSEAVYLDAVDHGPAPRRAPEPVTAGDSDGDAGGDTGGTGPERHESTSNFVNERHFLDRRLPDDFPHYLRHLQHLWRERSWRLPSDEYYRLSTWYIHHEFEPRWTTPRYVELEGDGQTWHQDILSAWRDQLHNDQTLNIAVVFPEPRDEPGARPVHGHLILVQGDPERAGGVVTVYPPSPDAHARFTWAVSLPRQLSGIELLQQVEMHYMLQHTTANIFHGWHEIPVNTIPNHWMMNGHSFVILFHSSPHAASSSVQPLGGALGSTDIPTGSADRPDSLELDDEEEADALSALSDSQESHESESAASFEDDLRGVHVFGLAHPHQHCFVRWSSYTSVLLDIVHALGIPRDTVIGFHDLAVMLSTWRKRQSFYNDKMTFLLVVLTNLSWWIRPSWPPPPVSLSSLAKYIDFLAS